MAGKYIVVGRVHPERADVSFGPFTAQVLGGGAMSIRCESSQVTVVVDNAQLDGFIAGFIAAKQLARMIATALGFSLGTGYSVELVQVIEEIGDSHVFGARPGNLHFEPFLPVFEAAVLLSSKDVFLRHALQDYVRAISEESDCAFLCYRAIEALCSSFKSRDGGGNGWVAMHTALGTRRKEIDSTIKSHADPVRHGNWASMQTTTSDQRNAMLLLTRDILNRYLCWASAIPEDQPKLERVDATSMEAAVIVEANVVAAKTE